MLKSAKSDSHIYVALAQEEGAERIKTYPREIEGVIRQGETKRAEARKRKKEKQQQERARQEAEIQRLKTLKRREIEER